ncbi:DUF2336 domain-containing protein [Pararhodospirillum photometricum]|uniref:DUF2336 domain-containing protein n=1 Tax=Pararhodospirillum photometricum TaxID=1084 RepID=UPI0002FCA222|nr:DUF2336 domain-containing protein [Pararhodospirillum photometricum]
MTRLLDHLLAEGRTPPLSYEEARTLARHEDAQVRAALARRADTMPEILYYLAEDPDPGVRRAIADNAATPVQANLLLTGDTDLEVRLALAQKIATLAPGLTEHEQDRVRHQTYEALARLARDQIPVVRALIADALKDVADAPPVVIGRLARDAELAVCAPVLTFSPVLTDADLLEIIRTQPCTGRLSAIARRGALAVEVTDALAASEDAAAIADMLANQGAQIREETLDALIDHAPSRMSWHAPLVRRPRLHAGAAQRLALFVADTLVEALMRRKDLDPAAAQAVSDAVRQRLAGGPPPLVEFGPHWRQAVRDAYVLCQGRRDKPEARLADLMAALAVEGASRLPTVVALVAVMGDVSPFAVAATLNAASAKGILSMAWKAGLSAEVAQTLQHRLAHLPPDEILRPTASGDYPLSAEEMLWQVEMFCDSQGDSPPCL